ncbi:MAG: DsbA family protein [Patescibacteria group bacterium]
MDQGNLNKTEAKLTPKHTNPMVLPISIVIAGVIIAAAIILSSNSSNISKTNNTNISTNTTHTATPPKNNKDVTVSLGTYPVEGNLKTAKIGIVEYGDFQCPFCKQFANNAGKSIYTNFVKTGQAVFAFRDYPLVNIHPLSSEMAIEGRCFAAQGKFWQYYNKMYTTTQDSNTPSIVSGYARAMGLNMNKYAACVTNKTYQTEIQKDIASGNRINIQGTPTIVIGTLKNGKVQGQLILGAYSYSYFANIIKSYL